MATPKDIRTPASDRCGFLNTATLTVEVGTYEKATFTVHEGLISGRSKFFRNAMKESWLESHDKTIKLPEDDPDIFALYLELLYKGRLPVVQPTPSDDPHGLAPSQFPVLAGLYVFAEKVMDIESKNIIVEAMFLHVREGRYPGLDAIPILYDGTPVDCPGRLFFADAFARFGNLGGFEAGVEIFPRDFLIDVSRAFLDRRGTATRDQAGSFEMKTKYLEKVEDSSDTKV